MLAQGINHLGGLVHAEGGLGDKAEIIRVLHLEFGYVIRCLHQIHAPLAVLVLSHGADHLGVAGVTDEHCFGALAAGAMDLHVHLGHQWAGSVEHLEGAGLGHLAHRLGDTVGGEDNDAVIGYLIQLLDEHGSGILELVHHIAVVHHLMADIDGGTELLQCTLDDADGAVDTGAKAAGIGQQDIHQSTFSSSSTPRISTSKVTVWPASGWLKSTVTDIPSTARMMPGSSLPLGWSNRMMVPTFGSASVPNLALSRW